MSGESAEVFLTRLRQSGLFPSDLLDELANGLTPDSTPEHILRQLQERGSLTPEQAAVFANEPYPLSLEPVEPDAPQLTTVPDDGAGEVIVPDAVVPDSPFDTGAPARKRIEPPMSRQTMWTWFAFGGALWLVGFLVLGIWLGGCFDSTPANPKNGRTSP
jgi:hypothetical protein